MFLFNIYEYININILMIYLIAEVDAELFKAIKLKDLKSSYVEDTNEDGLLHSVIHQGVVALLHDEVEHPAVEASGYASNGLIALVTILTLGHPLSSNL